MSVHFRKQPDGGWAFDLEGRTYIAYRNAAGFEGRAWYLTRLGGEVGTVNELQTTIEDMLATRAECVEVAREDAERENR